MERFKTIFIATVFAVIAVLTLVFAMPRIDRYLSIRGVEACSMVSSYVKESEEEEYSAKYPIEKLYKECLSYTE